MIWSLILEMTSDPRHVFRFSTHSLILATIHDQTCMSSSTGTSSTACRVSVGATLMFRCSPRLRQEHRQPRSPNNAQTPTGSQLSSVQSLRRSCQSRRATCVLAKFTRLRKSHSLRSTLDMKTDPRSDHCVCTAEISGGNETEWMSSPEAQRHPLQRGTSQNTCPSRTALPHLLVLVHRAWQC